MYHQLSNTTCSPINTLNIYPCPVSEGPKESHLGGVWWGPTLPHWRPMWGSSDQGGTQKGCPKLHWSHQPRQRTATSAPAPPWTAATASRGAGRQRSYRHRQPSAASLPQIQPGAAQASRPSARGPGAQGPMLQEEMGGDHASLLWWRGVPIRTVPGPPRSYLRGPAVGPPPSPSSQPLQPASPRKPPPAEAAAPGLRSLGRRGRVGLACDTGEVWR